MERRRSRRRAGLLLVLVVGAPAAVLAEASGSGSSSSSGSSSGVDLNALCRYNAWNGSIATVDACMAKTNAELELDPYCQDQILTARQCDSLCPFPGAPDNQYECKEHYHTVYATFTGELSSRNSLQWNIFFLCLFALIGAFSKVMFPKWLPYTVGLLVIGMSLGIIAQRIAAQTDCPWISFMYDSDHDHAISREEWDGFVCTGCHPQSFCKIDSWHGMHRTCWDGDTAVNGSGCRWDFDELDSSWRRTFMTVERTTNRAGNGQLEADELWTPQCNLMRDMLGLSDIDPHVLLVVFLPALLFESACFGLDVGIFRMQIVQICLLAFPAMIVASGLTGALIYAANSGEWNFWPCWLIGIISSATDPVAVVALLKELGASKALGTLIEGESLLNDGSAVVLYTWVRNCIGYSSGIMPPGWMLEDGVIYERFMGNITAELFRIITQMLIFGVAYGVCFGWATMTMCRLMYNKQFIEGPIVLAMSYLCFWIGELVCGTSAVIGVVIMGLYCNYHRSNITAHVFHFLHQLYGMAAHILNTVIFAICGAKLGFFMGDGSLLMLWETYWWQILMIYPFVLLARGAAITLFFPALSRMGTGCTWREAVIMWWGGLRGSVGLALALGMHHSSLYSSKMWGEGGVSSSLARGFGKYSQRLDCRDLPMEQLLMTVFVVFLTVVANGMTMAPLMRRLKMTDIPDDRKFMLNAATRKLAHETERFISMLAGQKVFADVSWPYVDRAKCSIKHSFTVEDPQRAAWLQVLCIERASYLSQFEAGRLGSEAFMQLESFMATLNAHAAKTPGNELSAMYDREFEAFLQGLLKSKDQMRLRLTCEVAMAYIKGQQIVQHSAKVGITGGEFNKWYEIVKYEHRDNLEQMVLTLQTLQTEFPQVILDFKDMHASSLVLHHQREMVEHMLHEGLLPQLDAGQLLSAINKRLKRLYFQPFSHKIERELHSLRNSNQVAPIQEGEASTTTRCVSPEPSCSPTKAKAEAGGGAAGGCGGAGDGGEAAGGGGSGGDHEPHTADRVHKFNGLDSSSIGVGLHVPRAAPAGNEHHAALECISDFVVEEGDGHGDGSHGDSHGEEDIAHEVELGEASRRKKSFRKPPPDAPPGAAGGGHGGGGHGGGGDGILAHALSGGGGGEGEGEDEDEDEDVISAADVAA
mmetsp:Transcript_53912/g.159752  ORF Transcript_53912/g.159752 Transcript_53912/m.159752 type:complete len:1155 (-) Transcript_53912:469-3933(-)